MTTLALGSIQVRPLPLNWRRVSALSGSFTAHIAFVMLLLIPPVAMQLRHVSEDTPPIIATLPPEAVPEPPMPVAPAHPKTVPTHPQPVITITAPVPNPEPTQVAPVDSIAPPLANQHVGTDTAVGDGVIDTAPSALAYRNRTEVPYPRDAVRRHEQGTVLLRVLVGVDGTPQQIEIDRSSGSHALDNAARDAVRHWSFKPGVRGGVAYAAWAIVPISFSLPQ